MNYDVIIVGGGMVGAITALALAERTALSIAVLEANEEIADWSSEHYHHRVSAITLASQRIFKSLNLWDKVASKRISPFTAISVWDGASEADVHFDCRDIAESQLGFIIENNLMQQEALKKIKECAQITYLAPVTLTAFHEREQGAELITEEGVTYRAKLVIAADGANSWLRREAGITITQHDYEQEAIVAMVKTTLPHQKRARQVFLSTGPLAHLPLQDPHATSIVWSLPKEKARELMTLSKKDVMLALTQAFGERLGSVTSIDHCHAFPLRRQQANDYCRAHLAMIGDAAHVIHPLAGQGVNLGLLDAASLVDVIEEAIKRGRDFSSLATLRRYERWRRADNATLLASVDLIKNIFESDKKIIRQCVGAGLQLTNRFSFLKNLFTHYAVGNRFDLPLLARG